MTDSFLRYLKDLPGRKASGLLMPAGRLSNPNAEAPHASRYLADHIESACWKLEFEDMGPEDKARLFSAIGSAGGALPLLIAQLMLHFGLFEGEARRVRWEEIDLINGVYTQATQDGEQLKVFIPQGLLDVLKAMGNQGQFQTVVPLHLGRHTNHLAYQSGDATKAIARAWKKLNLRKLTPHRLRASFATIHAFSLKTPLPSIQKMLRHTNIETTMRYVQVPDEAIESAQANFDRALTWGPGPKDEQE